MKKKMICLAGLLIAASTYAQTDVTTGIMRGSLTLCNHNNE